MLTRVVTKPTLRFMLVAMPVAMCILGAISVDRYARQIAPSTLYLSLYILCTLVLVIGLFLGVGVVWQASRTTAERGLFSIATPLERAVWIGGAVFGLFIAIVFLCFSGSRWTQAFEPMMFCALTLPAIAQVSAGRRLA